MSSKDADKPSSETPGVWPPAPQGTPPAAATPASPMPRRRTLTPYAWLDGLLGLPGGAGMAYGLFLASILLLPSPEKERQALAGMGGIALACAALCLLVGRRFPVLAALMAVGAAVIVACGIFLIQAFMGGPNYQ